MTRVARWALCILMAVAMSFAATSTRAEAPTDKRAQASSFFDAGAQAYDAGQYLVAAEAFLKAHDLLPSPTLLFSAAQAYRRQYLQQPTATSLERSIALYRDYLRADPKAARREDAMDALKTLVPLASLQPSQPPLASDGSSSPSDAPPGAAPPAAAVDPGRGTRLLLSARPDGSQISLDNAPFRPTPFVANVTPGAHSVRVQAPGHFDAQATASAVANELMPFHLALRPKPARLLVKGNAGARVLIDGQVRAILPAETALEIEPGPHAVTVALRGHKPFAKRIEPGPDKSAELEVRLRPTPQRIAAWTILSAGAAGAITTGVLAGFALARQDEALKWRDERDKNPLLPGERDLYNEAVLARNELTTAALITGGATVLTLAGGIGLFVLDEPEVLPPSGNQPGTHPDPTPPVNFTVGILSAGLRVVF